MKKTFKILLTLVVVIAAGIFLWKSFCAEAAPNVRKIAFAERSVGPVPADNFTGTATLRGFFPASETGVSTGEVSFEPCARTAWHTHPRGQMLIVTSGRGFVQQWEGEAQEISEGDTVWIPADVKHWHGAGPNTSMSHIAMAPLDEEGRSTTWMEKVGDEEYAKAVR